MSGLELRIWKGKAIYKKGTLDLGGHFGQAKGHQGHPRKGTKAPPPPKKRAANPIEGVFKKQAASSIADTHTQKKLAGRQLIRSHTR